MTIAAPPQAVWGLIADVSSWVEWGPFDTAELEVTGDPEPAGPGAVRRFTTGRRTTRELVVTYDAPRVLEYRLLSGIPVRDYSATVRLQTTGTGTGTGTVVTWSSHFRPAIPGTGRAIRKQLERFIVQLLNGLAAQAEAQHGAETDMQRQRPGWSGYEWPAIVDAHADRESRNSARAGALPHAGGVMPHAE